MEIRDAGQLAAYEEKCLSQGYEGVMIRTPHSPYKCGRSTAIKFAHQPSGAKEAPRFPKFIGFREAWDLGKKQSVHVCRSWEAEAA